MKRKALLIGNTDGLAGVKLDLSRFKNFLKSDIGGAWYDNEIDIVHDAKKSTLLQKIALMKAESFDYVIVVFSGHGGQDIRETVLALNKDEERIEEKILRNISPRQLNIYDCCRCFIDTYDSVLTEERFSITAKSLSTTIRKRYEARILNAIPQQILLYSCSIGEVSYDTEDGGVYLKNLLAAARNIDVDFKLVGSAHEETKLPTRIHSILEGQGEQNPSAVLPKCFSSQQLIISIV